MTNLKVLVCISAIIVIVCSLSSAQVPIGPDLVPPIAPIPEAPAGAKTQSTATTTLAAPPKPSPHKPGESQVYGVVTDQSGAVLPGATVTRLWRTVTRRKYQLTRNHVRLQNQLEGLLEECHIKLSSLVSDLLGASRCVE